VNLESEFPEDRGWLTTGFMRGDLQVSHDGTEMAYVSAVKMLLRIPMRAIWILSLDFRRVLHKIS